MTPDRYAAQRRTRLLGGEGQERLRRGAVAVVGVGATGGAAAEALARAGVGRLRLIDRDVPELGNLHRQVLYDEADVRDGLPKAEAAAVRLRRVNADVQVEARVADLRGDTALGLLEGVDVVVDGTDTFHSRLVLGDACAALGVPWVYTGVVGVTVHTLTIVPGRTACLRCLTGGAPPPGSVATCEAEGVLGPTVLVGGGLAALQALGLLAGRDPPAGLTIVDAWARTSRTVAVERDPDCPTCAGRLEHLAAAPGEDAAPLCGEDAVLLRGGAPVSLPALAARLAPLGRLGPVNPFVLRFEPAEPAGASLTVFADGRAVVRGTREPGQARGLFARWVGG